MPKPGTRIRTYRMYLDASMKEYEFIIAKSLGEAMAEFIRRRPGITPYRVRQK